MTAFDEMNSFVRVVEAGSISRAAEQMGLAKSGVSRRLADLESRLGVRLMNRTTRRSSLTDAGRTYYEGAVKLLSDVAELMPWSPTARRRWRADYVWRPLYPSACVT